MRMEEGTGGIHHKPRLARAPRSWGRQEDPRGASRESTESAGPIRSSISDLPAQHLEPRAHSEATLSGRVLSSLVLRVPSGTLELQGTHNLVP